MDKVTETLFSPFERIDGNAVFIHARQHPLLSQPPFTLEQSFKPFADQLQGLKIATDISGQLFDHAFVQLPKDMTQARYDVARALVVLREGGVIAIAGANDANGKRAEGILDNFGVENIFAQSGNKARVAWGNKRSLNENAAQALKDGAVQFVAETQLHSQPGLFGWDKIDAGSAMLAEHLPGDLKGAGADFGCGYGYLSVAALSKAQVTSFVCVDADARAFTPCRLNLNGFTNFTPEFLWADLTQPQTGLRNLDFIVMNPPFHEGKKADSAIGRAFIQRAAESLKPGGQLWMVANASLPYEQDALHLFSKYEKIGENKGFKVFQAIK